MNYKEVIKTLYGISTELIISYDDIESELTNKERKELLKIRKKQGEALEICIQMLKDKMEEKDA